ncbi:MAG TPA: hypothetical protein VK979_00385 [Guyparkeria sp.]|nr:hypothetical protein [Guyparkeria sp.]
MSSVFHHKRSRILTILAGLAIGVAILVLFIVNREPPPLTDDPALNTAVRFIEVQPIHPVLVARGFGTAESARPWKAVANVSGKIVQRHAALENGEFVEAGTELLVIDPSRYQLNLDQATADIRGLAAERRELEQERENTEALYRLEQDRLVLSEQELRRAQSLADRGMLSANQLDAQKRTTLQQRQATQSLLNQLNQIPVRIEKLEARQEEAEARRRLATEDLDDTRIVAPYDLRIGTVNVEIHQQVSRGDLLFRADGIDTTEVPLQIPLAAMRELVAALGIDGLSMDGLVPNMAALSGITARARVGRDDQDTWPARIVRVSAGLDPATRTLPVVLAIDEPYRSASPPQRTALVPETFVEGVLSIRSSKPRLVVPSHAIHEGELYLVDEQNRLQRRSVTISSPQDGWVIVHSGLQPGERVIIDDPIPAIDGMPLNARHDPDAEQRLIDRASGSKA